MVCLYLFLLALGQNTQFFCPVHDWSWIYYRQKLYLVARCYIDHLTWLTGWVIQWFNAPWCCICRSLVKALFLLNFRPLSVFVKVRVQAQWCLWHLFGLFIGNPASVITAAVWKHRKVKSFQLGDISVSMSHIYINHIL